MSPTDFLKENLLDIHFALESYNLSGAYSLWPADVFPSIFRIKEGYTIELK